MQLALAAELTRADARRHVGVLRPRGGRRRPQRAGPARAGAPGLGDRRLRGPGRADERGHRGRLQRHAARRGPAHGRRGPLGARVDGPSTRSTPPARCCAGSRRTRPADVEVDGLVYRESLNAVLVSGGTAANVIPDACVVTVNYRFAPSASVAQASARTSASCSTGTTSRSSTPRPGARPGLDDPAAQEFARRGAGDHGRCARGQVRLDRRRPVLRARRPRRELRPRGPAAGPQAGRALRRSARSPWCTRRCGTG